MSNGLQDLQAVMEGKGAYNKYATLQAAGGALALPLLEKAALEIDLGPEDAPIVIADYGSSQGKNSLAPMRAAIPTLRTRIGPNRPIIVFHTDQPGNDFNTLFETLNTDPDRSFGRSAAILDRTLCAPPASVPAPQLLFDFSPVRAIIFRTDDRIIWRQRLCRMAAGKDGPSNLKHRALPESVCAWDYRNAQHNRSDGPGPLWVKSGHRRMSK